MSIARTTTSRRRIWILGIVYSVVILAVGLWVSVSTGEWLALVCAGGLVAFPTAAVAIRSRKSPH